MKIFDLFYKFIKNKKISVLQESGVKTELSEMSDYQMQIDILDKRIAELNKRYKETRSDNINWEIVKQTEIKICQIPIFQRYSFKNLITLSYLKKERVRKEKERLAKLANELSNLISKAQSYVNQGNLIKSRELYTIINSKINLIQDKGLIDRFLNFTYSLRHLQKKINEEEQKRREEEFKRKEEERRRREEEFKRKEEERKRRKEEERKRLEEEERKRKERERKEQERLAEARRKEAAVLAERQRLNSINEQKKDNAKEILRYLNNKGVKHFYHFTDRRNLISIKKHGGLLSWGYCKQKNIIIPNPGGDDLSRQLDCRYNLQNYVRVSFCDDHPMAYRCHKNGADLILLKISVEVATFLDTIFCDMNATDSGHSKGANYEDLLEIDIRATQRHYVSKDDDDFKPHQAEVMINTFIPACYILNIDNPQIMNF